MKKTDRKKRYYKLYTLDQGRKQWFNEHSDSLGEDIKRAQVYGAREATNVINSCICRLRLYKHEVDRYGYELGTI